MVNYPMSEDEMKVRQYFNKLGNLSEKEVENYLDTLSEKYENHLNNHDKVSLGYIKSEMGSQDVSLFKKMNSLERMAKVFKDVEEDLSFIDAWKFKRDFDF